MEFQHLVLTGNLFLTHWEILSAILIRYLARGKIYIMFVLVDAIGKIYNIYELVDAIATIYIMFVLVDAI